MEENRIDFLIVLSISQKGRGAAQGISSVFRNYDYDQEGFRLKARR